MVAAKRQHYICPGCGHKMKIDKAATGKSNKSRGNSYEYRVAKKLTRLSKLKFKRTPQSGGWEIPGDIYCVEWDELPFEIECKNRSDVSLARILKKPECLLSIGGKEVVGPSRIFVFSERGEHFAVVAKDIIDPAPWWAGDITRLWIGGRWYYMGNIEYLAHVVQLVDPRVNKEEENGG